MVIRKLKIIVLLSLLYVSILIVVHLSWSPTTSPDTRGIGGGYKPNSLQGHSKMDDWFRVNGDGDVYTTNSEGTNVIYVSADD